MSVIESLCTANWAKLDNMSLAHYFNKHSHVLSCIIKVVSHPWLCQNLCEKNGVVCTYLHMCFYIKASFWSQPLCVVRFFQVCCLHMEISNWARWLEVLKPNKLLYRRAAAAMLLFFGCAHYPKPPTESPLMCDAAPSALCQDKRRKEHAKW